MSTEETKKYFDIEKEKHFDFFIPLYKEKNWIVLKDNINCGYPISWDVNLEIIKGKNILVDEKVRIGNYNDFLVEILQDINSVKTGWLYGRKDYILYGIWDNIQNIQPKDLYIINSNKLKEYIFNLNGFTTTCISKKGWGNTWNIVLDWNKLIEKQIAKKLI